MLFIFNRLKRIQVYKKELKYLSGCNGCCYDGKLNCPEKKCNCDQKLIKDCVCVEWSVPYEETQTVFQSGGFGRIFASGYITFDAGSSDFVIVRFFLGTSQVGSAMSIFKESGTAFSFTEFDSITVEHPATGVVPLNPSEGEICIKTRTPVF